MTHNQQPNKNNKTTATNNNTNSNPEHQLQRRESLVKPTWQNVIPGQVPQATLEKLNKLESNTELLGPTAITTTITSTSSASSSTIGASDTSTNVNNNYNNNSSQFQRTKYGGSQRQQVELFDIFGKVMLLGDSGVGKTCLLVRFRDGTFLSGNFISTVGIDFRNKIVTLDNTKVKLQIWDTAGQERFRSVMHAYYRDAHALLLLYDVTNKVSFDNIRAWLGEIREYAQDNVVIMLLGNKADCPDRQVRREDGERLAKEYNVAFMETSAKTGLNVELTFLAVARKLKSRKSDSIDESRFNVQEYVKEQTHKSTCPPCNF